MKQVIAYVHSHWDREWYREFEEFRLRLIEVVDEILSALENNEIPCFYFDGQTCALEDYLEIRKDKLELIKKLIKEKKLRIGPFYCSVDSFLVSGELFIKNLELGTEKSKELGEKEFIGYLSDTFGHSEAVCYILKYMNINKACLWRGLGDKKADLNWNGINVLYLIQGYFQDFLNLNLPIEQKAVYLKKYLDKISNKSGDYILLPIGADHLTIAKNLKEQIEELNKIYKEYKIKISTPFEYFNKITKREKVRGEFLDNSLNFTLSGVYSSRIYIKQANQHSQWLLSRIAEPLNSIAHHFYNAKNKKEELDYAYKTLIKNHAHDSIYGCSTDKVHREMMTRFENVNTISNGIIKRSLRDLSMNESHLSVINLSEYEYNGCIKIVTAKKLPPMMNAIKVKSYKGFSDKKLYNINEIPVTEDYTTINEYLSDVKNLKPFSITKITDKNINKEIFLKTTKNSIENQYIKFEVKDSKIIITDKKTDTKYTDFITVSDRADIGDSYNFGALKNDKEIKSQLLNWKLIESNNIRAVLKLTHIINIPKESSKKGRSKKVYKHKINTDVILYNQSKYIEFKTDWENKSKNHILQINFKLKDKIYKTINEDLFGTTERKFNPDYNICDNLPKEKGKEVNPNTSPMQRFMSCNNFGLITKGNQEYEVEKNFIKLTLLRATGRISEPENPNRTTPAGPPIETPELQCIGKNSANFAITFTVNEMFKLSNEFYNSTLTLFTDIEDKVFFKTENKIVYSVKTNNENIQLRVFDNNKKEISNIVIK